MSLTNFTFGIGPRMSCRDTVVFELEAAAAPDVAVMAEAVDETALLIASWNMLCNPAICKGVCVPSDSRRALRDLDLSRECLDRFLERSLLFERERFRDFRRDFDFRFRERELDRECDFRRDDMERNFYL